MIIILMGVAGSGKTTVGGLLAKELGWEFLDADSFHPQANVNKMVNGVPLEDADRQGHFFGPELLRSRFDALEEPEQVPTIEATDDPSDVVVQIRRALNI